MKSSQKIRLTVKDDVEVATTAPWCGDSLSPQFELRLAAENGNVPAMYHYASVTPSRASGNNCSEAWVLANT